MICPIKEEESWRGYRHRITFLKGQQESALDMLPRVHLVASLLKRWLLGTHQGAVSREHLDYSWTSSRSASTDGIRAAVGSSSSA